MKKFQTLAIGLTIIAAFLSSAVAAPSSTRHSKLLSIKQRVMINTGESRTSASLVSPTAHSSNGGVVVLTNNFAAVPLPDTAVKKFQDAGIPRFNYEAFWAAIDKVQACEDELANNAASYVSPHSSYDDGNSFAWFIQQQQLTSARTYANQIMAGYPSASSFLPQQYQSPTGSTVACNNGGNPAALKAAAVVRQSVSNYSLDSPEALEYVTSQFWIKDSGAANPLKAAVIQYLRENEIDFAWVDVEFEYPHTSAAPTNRRIAMSFQINRADDLTTRGSYLGSQLILAPGLPDADSLMSVRANRIDIKYSAYSQYPDFTINSSNNTAYLQQLQTAGGFNPNGVLSWNITQKGNSAISSRICSGINNCSPTTAQFKSTSGAYDPDFARAGFDSIPNAPYTLENPGPIEDLSGITCLVKGVGSPRCRLEKHNVATLMQYANAIDGTLDYLGRWEVDFSGKAPGQTPTFEEQGRRGVFDVCYGVELQNTITANYWVRRPRWKLNLYWQASGVDYQFAEAPKYEFESIARLPDPITYTTYPTAKNNFNLLGSEQDSDIRANNTPEVSAGTTDSSSATNYAAINLGGYDPQTFGLPDREGALMINPFVSSVSSTGTLYNGLADNWMIYRPIGSLAPEDTVVASMRGNPIYKKADVSTPSNALPRGWLARGNLPLVRKADFNCVDQNEPAVRALIDSSRGTPAPTQQYFSPPPDPIIPIGTTAFAGTVSGHKVNTRPNVSVPGEAGSGLTADPCQLSYVPWSNVNYAIIPAGPLPDPAFFPPAICATLVNEKPYSGSECIPPLNFFTKTVQINRVDDLVVIAAEQKACNETCELGGAIKLCPRPYQRF